jgi:NTE family protein
MRMTEAGRTRVAIACQGGGSHTAFTAGVLKRLLGAEELAGFEVVGLSGTSGGAVCAARLVGPAGRRPGWRRPAAGGVLG